MSIGIGQSIVLGLVQGLTEFIPVSSSGHLVIAQYFFSGASDHIFVEFLDVGTLIALIIFFRHRIAGIFHEIFVERRYKLLINIILTTIPAGIIGLIFGNFIETNAFFNSIVTVVVALAVVGFIMVIVELLPHARPVKDGERLPASRALLIGIAQIAALVPGVSRSGSTIVAGRLSGFNPEAAAEYSFLASIPIITLVCLKDIVVDRHYMMAHLMPLFVSNLFAFGSGLLAVGFLMRYLSKHSISAFGWYRLALAAVMAVVLLVKVV